MSNTRKTIVIILLAFIVYAVFTRPGQSANTVDSGWDKVKQGTDSVATFFDALLS